MSTSFGSVDLWFLGDPELVYIVRSTLEELDEAATQGLSKSTVFLASSALEGMLNYMKKQLPNMESASAVTRMCDVKRDVAEAAERAMLYLPSWFPDGLNYLWPFRNHVHALNELEQASGRTIDESIANLAIALLAAYIQAFSTRRFIAQTEWLKESGRPEYHKKSRTIELPVVERPAHSFLRLAKASEIPFSVSFKVSIPNNGMFNIVYNYKSNKDFRMIRLDKRRGLGGIHEGLLVCDDWFHWTISEPHGLIPPVSPEASEHEVLEHEVTLRATDHHLHLEIDRVERTRPNDATWDFEPRCAIGFFNEEVRVTMSKFKFTTGGAA